MNPVTATCVKISAELPKDNRQIRRSRTGWRSRSVSSSPAERTGPSTNRAAASTAPSRLKAASATNAAFVPEWSAIAGTASAAAKPPIGTEVWRIPSARPRCSRGNQLVTTRPLAVLIDAPNAPDSVSADDQPGEPRAYPAAASPTAAPRRPTEPVTRSPIRSAAIPHGSSVSVAPTLDDGEHHADLREAQPVAVAQRGRQHRQPAERRRLRRLRDRPGREDDPAQRYARRSGYSCRLELPSKRLLVARNAFTSALRRSTVVSVSQGMTVPCEIRARKSCSTGAKPCTYGCWSTTKSSVPSATSARSPGSRSYPPA